MERNFSTANVTDFIMNRMCYEYARWISFAALYQQLVINLYARQNRWSISIFLFFRIRPSSSPLLISSMRFVLSFYIFSPLPPFFTCFDYLPLLSRFNFDSFCSDYKANSIFHIQSIGEERREGEREREKGRNSLWRGVQSIHYHPLKSKSSPRLRLLNVTETGWICKPRKPRNKIKFSIFLFFLYNLIN